MSFSNRTAPLSPGLLLSAARRVLRPLVRLMMRNGVTFPALADTLRRLFVDVAVNEILTDPRSRTDSRVSLLTGVHRKEIKRLREMPRDRAETPETVTIASQVIATWVGADPFLDAAGRPRALPRVTTEAGVPSFDTLAESVTTDIRPRAILDDLLDQGVVFLDDTDCVRLITDAFIPRPGGEEQLFYFARNLHDHVAAAVANISTATTPVFLDRSVHYDQLTEEQARLLQLFARDVAMRALLDVNRRAIELTEGSAPDPTATRRVNFGIYLLHDPETLTTAASVESPVAGDQGA